MAQPDCSQTVIVLDLDDTLYKEADYQASGLSEVCRWIEGLYGISLVGKVELLKLQGETDILGGLCRLSGLPLTVKDSLLWIYRLHEPTIHLSLAVKDTVDLLNSLCRVAILTDGRSISQRKKLKSLGLSHLPAYVSEEHASEKPSLLRFELIMRDMPALDYVYVADNPRKDFLAPNALSWRTFGLVGNARNIHSQECADLTNEYLPQKWISSLDELIELL